jgi:hypothetical protein
VTQVETENAAIEMVDSSYKSTVEFVFAPAERDVYRYRPTPKDLAPLGAKFGSGRLPAQAKAVGLLRSSGSEKGPLAINILPRMGRSSMMFGCTSKLNPRIALFPFKLYPFEQTK